MLETQKGCPPVTVESILGLFLEFSFLFSNERLIIMMLQMVNSFLFRRIVYCHGLISVLSEVRFGEVFCGNSLPWNFFLLMGKRSCSPTE